MIQITPHMKIFICVKPVDFRKGINGLTAVCRNILKEDPFSGIFFVFKNRRGCSIKILVYDGQGFWVYHKRLSEGRFGWWPKNKDDLVHSIEAYELQQFIWNGFSEKNKKVRMWRKL